MIDSKELEIERQEGELAVYVHLPFCVRKCLYCDFISGVYERSAQESYVNKLCWEIEEFFRGEYVTAQKDEDPGRSEKADGTLKEKPEKPVIKSVFFGGGTPSILPAADVEKILCKLKEYCEFDDPEITIEVNPGTVEVAERTSEKDNFSEDNSNDNRKKGNRLTEYKRIGINRISIGMQSTCDAELKSLGRIHNYEEFLNTFRLARDAGFDNINVDVMYAIPGQDFASFEKTLRKTAELGPEHISAYSLIVEEGTPFAEMDLDLPSEEEERRMYASVAEILAEYGYHQYEISNYAKEGFECRHNKAYWTGKEYAGFGVAAASFLHSNRCKVLSAQSREKCENSNEWNQGNLRDSIDTERENNYPDCRYTNTESIEAFLKAETYDDLIRIRREQEILSKEEQMSEFVILGLRMNRGVKNEEFRQFFGMDLEEVFEKQILKHVKDGLLLQNENGDIVLTKRGFDLANTVMADFL